MTKSSTFVIFIGMVAITSGHFNLAQAQAPAPAPADATVIRDAINTVANNAGINYPAQQHDSCDLNPSNLGNVTLDPNKQKQPSYSQLFSWPEKWEISCVSANANDQKRIERLTKEGVLSDLIKLANLNPNVFIPLFKKASQRSVHFVCQNAPPGAAAALYKHWFSSARTIYLGQAWNGGWDKATAQNIILHEVLHALDLDNFFVMKHNSDEFRLQRDTDGIIFHNKDLPFACAAALSPGLVQTIYVRKRSYSSCIIKDTLDACVSCLSARLDPEGNPYVPSRSSNIGTAIETCNDLLKSFRQETEKEIQDYVRRGEITLRPEDC